MTDFVHPPQIVLASKSPRRRALLQQIGLVFDVRPADIDESVIDGESPEQYVERLASDKVRKVAEMSPDAEAILAADTAVVFGGQILGKPADKSDAIRMWRQLSGNTHQVYTGIALQGPNGLDTRLCATDVEFATIREADMERYWRSGEPQDKAGAYGIQALGSALVKRIHGSYSNVVGLPLYEFRQLLNLNGWDWL